MHTQTLDLDGFGVQALDDDALATVNGGFWPAFLVSLAAAIVWDTIKEIYNTWDEFVENFWIGIEAGST